MQNIRINKIICSIIVIILLLSGMCFDIQEAHSSLVYSFSQHESFIHAKKNICGQQKYFPALLEERIDQSVSEIFEKKESRSFFRNFRFSGFLGFLFQKQTNLFTTVWEYPYDPDAENAVVVNYIHHSDGKK